MVRHWKPKNYSMGEETQIVSLFKTVFGVDRSLKHWHWQYRDNPRGHAPIILGVDIENPDKLVGQYTVVPSLIKVGDVNRLGAQSVDTMTHPDYQRQGMFVELANRCYVAAKDMGIDLVYGFPNSNSYHGLVSKLNFADLNKVPKYRAITSTTVAYSRLPQLKAIEWLLAPLHNIVDAVLLNRGFTLPPGALLESIDSFDARFDELWSKVSQRYHAMVVRDAEYLNWRFISFPDDPYQILALRTEAEIRGYVVFAVRGDTAYLVDLLSLNPDDTRCLLQGVQRELRRIKIGRIIAYLNAHQSEVQVYEELGFSSVPSELVMIVRDFTQGQSSDKIYDLSSWYVTFSDTDGI